MSLWTLEREGEKTKLTFTHEPLKADGMVQPCGEVETVAESDLEAWVFDQAQPYDLIQTPRGLFVRQTLTTKNALVSA
jgi:hypothetical protein